jgi:beta-alanine--pyruvate transaminase
MGYGFAAERYGVTPDIINFAKGVTSGAAPMGGSIIANKIYDAFMAGSGGIHNIELFHGHTYSAHPIACAAAMATLDIYEGEGLFENACKMEKVLEEAVHSLKGAPFVVDIRNAGFAAGVELETDPKAPGRRGLDAIKRAFHDEDMVIRVGGDTIAISPPLIATESDVSRIIDGIRGVLSRLT